MQQKCILEWIQDFEFQKINIGNRDESSNDRDNSFSLIAFGKHPTYGEITLKLTTETLKPYQDNSLDVERELYMFMQRSDNQHFLKGFIFPFLCFPFYISHRIHMKFRFGCWHM